MEEGGREILLLEGGDRRKQRLSKEKMVQRVFQGVEVAVDESQVFLDADSQITV